MFATEITNYKHWPDHFTLSYEAADMMVLPGSWWQRLRGTLDFGGLWPGTTNITKTLPKVYRVKAKTTHALKYLMPNGHPQASIGFSLSCYTGTALRAVELEMTGCELSRESPKKDWPRKVNEGLWPTV